MVFDIHTQGKIREFERTFDRLLREEVVLHQLDTFQWLSLLHLRNRFREILQDASAGEVLVLRSGVNVGWSAVLFVNA